MQSRCYRVRRHAGKRTCEAFPLLLGDKVNCCAFLKPINYQPGWLLQQIKHICSFRHRRNKMQVCLDFILFFSPIKGTVCSHEEESAKQSLLMEHLFQAKSNSQGGSCSVCTGSCRRNSPLLRWRCWEPAPDRLRGINTRISHVFKSADGKAWERFRKVTFIGSPTSALTFFNAGRRLQEGMAEKRVCAGKMRGLD